MPPTTPSTHSNTSKRSARTAIRLLTGIALGLILVCVAHADNGPALRNIDNPNGGHVVYGIFDQESTMQGAMVSMLRKVHSNFGDRPQIGQFFRTKDGHTVGTFFNLTAKTQGGKPIAGMIMVTQPSGLKPAAAVLYDDAARFPKTRPELMKALVEAYTGKSSGNSGNNNSGQQQTPQNSAASGSSSASIHHGTPKPVPPMQRASTGDNAASMSLPAGWHLIGGGGGSIAAEGPKGESVHLGAINANNWNPNTPQGRNMIQFFSRGNTPFTTCAYTPDLVAAYQCISHQVRQRQHMPQPTMKVLNVQDLPPNQYEQKVVLVTAEMDFNDGKGLMKCSIHMGAQRFSADNWNLNVSQVNVPINLADEEWPTVTAIAQSWRQNGQVIQGQTDQVVANINAAGAANTARFNEHMKDIDRNAAAFEQHMDGIDRQSKSFQNYILDQSVVQDNEIPARGTLSNPSADSLVKANPNRYQIVDQKDWIKGQDY